MPNRKTILSRPPASDAAAAPRAGPSTSLAPLPGGPPREPRPPSGPVARAIQFARDSFGHSARWITTNTLQPAWLAPQWRGSVTGYILAAAGQITVTLISAGLITLAPNLGFRSALPLLVTVLIALTFGAGPSFFAAFWGAALVYFALLPPRYDLAARTPNDLAGILLLLAVGVAISILASQVTRSQRTAERAHAEALEARAEAAGRAEQLQTAFDAMADAVLLYDANKCLVRRNNALDRMLRFEQAPDFATLPDERRYAPLAVQDTEGNVVPLERMPQMCALAGEVFTGERAVDLRMVAFDGRTLDVNVSAAPVRDANGRITGSVTVYRDVTERRQLERRTQETLAALLEMAQALVTATPEDGPATATISASQPRARISSSQPIPPARQAARRLAELTQSVLGCKRVVITLVNPESDTIRPLAAVGLTPEQEAHMWATWPERATLGATLSPQDLARLRAGEALTSDLDADGLDRQRNPYSAHSALVAPACSAASWYACSTWTTPATRTPIPPRNNRSPAP